MTSRVSLVAFVLAACGSATGEPAPVPLPAERAATARAETMAEGPVAETGRFILYSRFEPNLHDRLRRWAIEEDRGETRCIDALGEREREPWLRAVATLRALFEGDENGRLELRIHYALGLPDVDLDESLGPVPRSYLGALAEAAPIYRACFWEDDDRRNREWIAALVPMLNRAEDLMASRIAAAHALEWPAERIPVDVVPFVNFGGGNTVVHPHHTLISSMQPGYDRFGGLEVIFHEGSHTFVSPRSEGAVAALRAAAERRGVELHRDLWHAILFLTAGHVARVTVRELWNEEYEPYMYSQGVLDRAWPELRAPLENTWLPYLEGRTTLERAADELIAAVPPS